MTQKDKELLLKDLCARLPYGVEVYYSETVPISKLKAINSEKGTCIVYDHSQWYRHNRFHIEEIKPYLRSMSSMTEKEMEELLNIDKKRGIYSSRHLTWHIDGEIINYLNKKMFDWRGLIPMGLALEAPKGMYN